MSVADNSFYEAELCRVDETSAEIQAEVLAELKTESSGEAMSTAEKSSRIAAYYLHHRGNGLSADAAVDHIAKGLGINRDTVLVAIHYFMTHES